MRLTRLVFFSLLTCMAAVSGCKKEDASKCLAVAAGQQLRFRVIDTAGADVLFARQLTPVISQPCRTTPLVQELYKYRLGNAIDSGVIIGFGNLNTPKYSEGVGCFRILFDWGGGNEDTVDWHYRSDEPQPGCIIQTIDYVSYNGIQARRIADVARPHYLLIKK